MSERLQPRDPNQDPDRLPRPSPRRWRWGVSVAVLLLGGILVSACTPPSVDQVSTPTPVVPGSSEKFPSAEPTLTPQERSLGIRYRNDLVGAVREFIGPDYLKHRIRFRSPSIEEDLRYWAQKLNQGNNVIEIIGVGPAGGQRFLVSNQYNKEGQLIETYISPEPTFPYWSIDLRFLPGINLPNREGGGDIPLTMLSPVAEVVFNLPWDNLKTTFGSVCSVDSPPKTTAALIATGRTRDNRHVRFWLSERASALLLVTHPSLGTLSVPRVCGKEGEISG